MDREAYCARSLQGPAQKTEIYVGQGRWPLSRKSGWALYTQQKEEKVLLTTAILELVENDCTNNNATLDNLLPIGRHIHQVESIVQYTDN